MTFRDDAQKLLEAAREMKAAGVDYVTVGDLAKKVDWNVTAVQTTLSYLDSKGALSGVNRSKGADDEASTGKGMILGFDGVHD